MKAVLLTVAAIAPAAFVRAADTPTTNSVDTVDDLQQLRGTLESSTSTPTQRDNAAHALVDLQSPGARAILQDLLQNPQNQLSQIAAAKALADDPVPDPAFITALIDMIGTSKAQTDAAASALANYGDNPDVFAKLAASADNAGNPTATRTAALRAMGMMSSKTVAAYLVDVLNRSGDEKAVDDAAADALTEMTGLHDNGLDRERWQQWWDANKGKDQAQWNAELLIDRARQSRRVSKQYAQLADSLELLLSQNYQLIPAEQKLAVLMSYLSSPVPEIRINAVKNIIVGEFKDKGRQPPEAVAVKLRELIMDADPGVRWEVANALFQLNDSAAAQPLIAQLAKERVPVVRQQIAATLGRLGDLRAVPLLVRMLDSANLADAAAAARAIKALGPALLQSDPAKAAAVADKLQIMINTRALNKPETQDLRAACVSALATLHAIHAEDLFIKLLQQGETVEVRQAALRGLGDLADPKTDEQIVGQLDDPDRGIQLEAARAYYNIATFAYAEKLYRMLGREVDDDVRAQAWKDLLKVLQGGTVAEITGWPDRFKDDPQKQLEANYALRDAAAKEKDDYQLAITRQNIGQDLMKFNPPRADEAAENFKLALDYWQNQGKNRPGVEITLDGLIGQTMDALLTAAKYDQATDFAAKQIAINPEYQRTVGSKLKNEADRLRLSKLSGDSAKATQLIDDALKMSPALDQNYQDDLKETRRLIATPDVNPGGP
jgi:HEAT repeat protein